MTIGDWRSADEHIERHGSMGDEKLAFTISYIGQRIFLVRESGNLDMATEMVAAARSRAPEFDVLHAMSALISCERQALDEATVVFEPLLAGGALEIHRAGGNYPATVAMMLEVAGHLDRPPVWLDAELEPYRSTLIVCSWGEACVGAADRFLAIASALRAQPALADAYFASALGLEDACGVSVLAARTQYWWAWSTLRGEGDTALFRDRLQQARDRALGLSMPQVVQACDRLARR